MEEFVSKKDPPKLFKNPLKWAAYAPGQVWEGLKVWKYGPKDTSVWVASSLATDLKWIIGTGALAWVKPMAATSLLFVKSVFGAIFFNTV